MIDPPWYTEDPVERLAFNMYAFELTQREEEEEEDEDEIIFFDFL